MNKALHERINHEIFAYKVVLYMRGTAAFPQCSLSAFAVEALLALGVAFKEINVLADPHLPEGLKVHANWPTLPVLYINGRFVGGGSYLRELYNNGALAETLKASE